MADERRDSSRTEMEGRSAQGGVRAGGATAELRTPAAAAELRSASTATRLSRVERHGGSQSGIISDKTKEVPAKKAKLSFNKKAEEPEEPDDVGELDEDEVGEDERSYPKWAGVSFWLFRKSIVPVVMIVMLIVGLYAGYVILGKAPKDEVFDWATWRHLYDLVFAES